MMRFWVALGIAGFCCTMALGDSDFAPESKPRPAQVKHVKKKGKRVREKEAEGTEAPDRFKADTVIKSQYKLHGEPLEVDPD